MGETVCDQENSPPASINGLEVIVLQPIAADFVQQEPHGNTALHRGNEQLQEFAAHFIVAPDVRLHMHLAGGAFDAFAQRAVERGRLTQDSQRRGRGQRQLGDLAEAVQKARDRRVRAGWSLRQYVSACLRRAGAGGRETVLRAESLPPRAPPCALPARTQSPDKALRQGPGISNIAHSHASVAVGRLLSSSMWGMHATLASQIVSRIQNHMPQDIAASRVVTETRDDFGAWSRRKLSVQESMETASHAWLENERGDRIPIKGLCTFGRVPGNSVVIPTPNVSRRHAMIQEQDTEFCVVDLGSTNGIEINGVRVTHPTVLKPGDRIGLPGVQFTFRQVADPTLPLPNVNQEAEQYAVTIPRYQTQNTWILLADLQGFTRRSQEMPANEIAPMVGKWVASCQEIIKADKGVLAKFLGDGFMAYWTAHEETPRRDCQGVPRICGVAEDRADSVPHRGPSRGGFVRRPIA